MKKILIVNNNMKVGGVQKSLYNLLWAVKDRYDITLCLFDLSGEYLDKLPTEIKVIGVEGLFRYFGVSQGECKKLSEKLTRGFLALWCKLFGRASVMKLIISGSKKLGGSFDSAIAFLHNGSPKSFYGGVQDFVLECVNAGQKIAFLHCDYRNCGADNERDNALIERFDRIAACSDGCRRTFVSVLPALCEKTVTVRNFHRFDEIHSLSEIDPVVYDQNYVNVIMVSRLAHEKGIERALYALGSAIKKGVRIKLHIVGNGPMKAELVSEVQELGLSDAVCFWGEHSNPYRFMKNADLFLMTSFHEAAPMVIDEAYCLGIPVLSTATTSSDEMIAQKECGWVCENVTADIERALYEITSDFDSLKTLKEKIKCRTVDNARALEQFVSLVEE